MDIGFTTTLLHENRMYIKGLHVNGSLPTCWWLNLCGCGGFSRIGFVSGSGWFPVLVLIPGSRWSFFPINEHLAWGIEATWFSTGARLWLILSKYSDLCTPTFATMFLIYMNKKQTLCWSVECLWLLKQFVATASVVVHTIESYNSHGIEIIIVRLAPITSNLW